MGLFSSDDHKHVYDNDPQGDANAHEGKWSHELVGGAAAFAATRAYENHQKENGKPANHALAKELVAGVAGAEVDKLFETKGLNFLDKEKAKHHAQQEAERSLEGQF